MTSLMDILTCLLLFLLKSFGTDEAISAVEGVDLPGSSSEDPVKSSLVVALSNEKLLLGGEPIATLAEIEQSSDTIVPALDARLRAERAAALEKAPDAAPTVVTLQGDRNLEFRVVQKVMATLEGNGYASISLAVVEDS